MISSASVPTSYLGLTNGGQPMSTKRVLVIDDEDDVRAVVRGCLEDIAGWQVRTVASGLEALAAVQAEQPDAILLDMMMPGMDGLTFLRTLRTEQLGAIEIPVVLLTAKLNFNSVDRLPDLGIRGIIPKPFEPFLLANQVAEFLAWEFEL